MDTSEILSNASLASAHEQPTAVPQNGDEGQAPDTALPMIGRNECRVAGRNRRNKAETDSGIGETRLKVLLPYALARLGRDYEIWDAAAGAMVKRSGPLPLRPHVRSLADQLACSTDLVFILVSRLCELGPENARASDMLKKEQGGGKGTSRLGESIDQLLDKAVWEVCVEQGHKPCKRKTNRAIRDYMISNGASGRLPSTETIKRRSRADKITQARTDAYARDHLNRICGQADEIKGLMSVVQLDTTQFTAEDFELLIVDAKGRNMGPANVIFGVLGSNRGVWTWLPFAGAANSYLAGLAVKRGLLSKEQILRDFGISGILPFHGKPGEILHDCGSEFVNDHLKRVIKDMIIGFDDRSPPHTPHYRGTLERFNRTAHMLFEEFLESEVGKRYVRPVPGRPKARGILLTDLDRGLTEWIVLHYHYRAHKGMGNDSPMSRMEKFTLGGNGLPASGLPPPVAETPSLNWDFLWEDTRVVNHLGIALKNRRYACSALNRLFAPGGRSSERNICIRFNPYAMKLIFVKIPNDDGIEEIVDVPWIPENDKFIMDEADRQASINPSLWEWDVLYADLRRGGVPDPKAGVVEALHAQREADAEKGRQAGAPSRRARITDNRNRGMREHFGDKDLPQTAEKPNGTGQQTAGADVVCKPENPPKKPSQRRPVLEPVYLAVGDGADAY